MAYYQNDFIKYNYPNQYYQNQMQNNQMNQQYQANNNGIIWVQGESGAKSYLVAPNSTVQLWDSESHTIYLKSADASGINLVPKFPLRFNNGILFVPTKSCAKPTITPYKDPAP